MTEAPRPPRLSPLVKVGLASGDLATNGVLASLSLVYASYFLIEVVGMRPIVAGLIPLAGRAVDAISDPVVGLLSDRTRTRWGRRRPWIASAAVPFGCAFALLWQVPPAASEVWRALYFGLGYVVLSVCMTAASVPHLALIPEMARDYDDRTSANAYRHVASVMGIMAALGIRPLAAAFGDGAAGFARAGGVYGLLVVLPWIFVLAVSRERPGGGQVRHATLGQELAVVARQPSFRVLVGLYLSGRIAIDLVAALMILYFTHWVGRSADFEPAMLVFLVTVATAAPGWLALSRRFDKITMFRVGALWWMAAQLVLLAATPTWPRAVLFVLPAVLGIGYAVVDFMPWAMVGDVVDEDEVESGVRREGLYTGALGLLRKLAGALAVFLALGVLDLAGVRGGVEPSPAARQAIRLVVGLGPVLFLTLSLLSARAYRLDRRRHAAILATLMRGSRGAPGA